MTAHDPSRDGTVATPIPAASVLIVRDDPFEVLMVKRNSRGSFPGALVFPGGVVEQQDSVPQWHDLSDGGGELEADAKALRIAGVRETWEEVGLLLAGTLGRGAAEASALSDDLFPSLVAAREGVLHHDEVHPFGNWITPVDRPRRWDTHFFLVIADRDEQEAVADGAETVSHEWIEPGRLVEEAERGVHPLVFPTLANVMRLAESSNASQAVAAAQSRTVVTVTPDSFIVDGRRGVLIPAEAGYALTEYFPPEHEATILAKHTRT